MDIIKIQGRIPCFFVTSAGRVVHYVPVSTVVLELIVQGITQTYRERGEPIDVPTYKVEMVLHGIDLPAEIATILKGEKEKQNEKIALTQAILKAAISDLKGRGLEFSFLVFVGHWVGESSIMEENDWRLATIISVLKEEKVNYVTTKDILREDMAELGHLVEKYFLPADGHYNGYTNRVISDKLKHTLNMCGSE